ncbi:MAG: M23 family metallopeptidase [Polyangiaceae bacterium]|nr:M23 family metallopeptidase [Polyangiaceae bacterium]
MTRPLGSTLATLLLLVSACGGGADSTETPAPAASAGSGGSSAAGAGGAAPAGAGGSATAGTSGKAGAATAGASGAAGKAGAANAGAAGKAGAANAGAGGAAGKGAAATAGAAGKAGAASGGACGCLLGDGPYCGARAKAEAAAAGCEIDALAGHGGDLLKCDGGAWSVLEDCAGACKYAAGSSKLDDACELPVCDCFVKVAWCGSGVAKEAAKMGCRVPLLPAHDGDILHCPGGAWAVKEDCDSGCVEAPSGTPDSCKGSSDYHAPFACGTTRTCSNGNHTSLHDGKDEYAYDFGMPIGTSVRAMRGGTVLAVRYVSKPGSPCYDGGGASCANYANTVEVRHPDGTVALYMHLSTPTVSKGETVKAGDEIGKSGNSGYSTGPHLHVQIQGACGIWWCQSVPFTFAEDETVSAGTAVKSGNCP